MAAHGKGGSSALRGSKAKSTKSVVFKLSSSQLRKWVDENDAIKPASKSSSATSTPPVIVKDSPPAAEIKAEPSGANTPDPSAATQPTNDNKDAKRRTNGGVKAGVKRGAAALDDTPANKSRAKPGPKRRKIDGPVDESTRPWTTPAAPVGHKLGPKANQGAINACLRALDRGGAPCRKWNRKPFVVKSFTGIVWELPTWATPPRPRKEDGGSSDEKKEGETPTSGSENNNPHAQGSSNVGSEAPGEGVAAASSPPAAATRA